MSLFTFISEVGGSTVVEQEHGDNIVEAVGRWGHSSQLKPKLNEDIVEIEATPVTGVIDVWCISGVTCDDQIFITHIVATAAHPTLVE